MKKAATIYCIFCLACCYLSITLVWNSITTNQYQLDDKFLSIDPENYKTSDFSLPSPIDRNCDNAECEYWNLVAEYIINPVKWMNSFTKKNYYFLGYPHDFHLSLPVPLFKPDLETSYMDILNGFDTLRNDPIFDNINDAKTVIHLDSNADFLHTYALYPSAEKYILFSKESASLDPLFIPLTEQRNIENLTEKQKERLDVLLISVHQYVDDLSKRSSEYSIDLVYPYLLVQIKIAGKTIVQLREQYEKFFEEEVQCLEILFTDDYDSFTKSLVYCSTELTGIDTESSFFTKQSEYEPFILLSNNKMSGYFENYYRFVHPIPGCSGLVETTTKQRRDGARIEKLVRNLLQKSIIVVQNEHNIPFYWFSQNIISPYSWETKFFGTPGLMENTNISFVDLGVVNTDNIFNPFVVSLDHKKRIICDHFPVSSPGVWVSEEQLCLDKMCICPVQEFVYCSAPHQQGFLTAQKVRKNF